MIQENGVIDIKGYQSARRCADELLVIIQSMTNIINELEEKVNGMQWSGTSANNFKTSVTQTKESLDDVYNNYIKTIPEKIDDSIRNYQMHETSEF